MTRDWNGKADQGADSHREAWLGDALRRHADAAELIGPEPDAVIAEGRSRVRRRRYGMASAGAGGLALAVTAAVVFAAGAGSPPARVIVVPEAGAGTATTVSTPPSGGARAGGPTDVTVGAGTIRGKQWSVTLDYSKSNGWCFSATFAKTPFSLGCVTSYLAEPTVDVVKPWISISSTATGIVPGLPCDLGVVIYRSEDIASIAMTADAMGRVVEVPVKSGGYSFTAFIAPLANADYTSTTAGGKAGPGGGNVLSGIPGAGC